MKARQAYNAHEYNWYTTTRIYKHHQVFMRRLLRRRTKDACIKNFKADLVARIGISD